jgi:hypothetical protein
MRVHIPKPGFAAIVMLIMAALTGCAGGPDGSGDAAENARVRGLWIFSQTLADGAFVEVRIRHSSLYHRVEQVALVAPDGARHRAEELRTERIVPESATPSGRIGVSGGSGGFFFTGIGISIPLGGLIRRQPIYRSYALVRIPDPAAYRANPARWKVAVVIDDRLGARQTIERPAPALR